MYTCAAGKGLSVPASPPCSEVAAPLGEFELASLGKLGVMLASAPASTRMGSAPETPKRPIHGTVAIARNVNRPAASRPSGRLPADTTSLGVFFMTSQVLTAAHHVAAAGNAQRSRSMTRPATRPVTAPFKITFG